MMLSRRCILAIVAAVVFGAIGIALLTLPNLRADHWLSLQSVVGASFLILATGVCGFAAGRRSCHQTQALTAALREMAARKELGQVEVRGRGEVGRLAEAVNAALEAARQQVESQTLAVREEQIRMRVLNADKQHMEAVLNSIADAVVVTNPFGDVTLANGSAERALGFHFSREERKRLGEVIDNEAVLAAVEQLRRSELQAPRKVLEIEYGSNGDARVYKTTINAVRTSVGDHEELSGLVTVLHDVTREREVARMKNDFVSKVTHELRTPLSSIRAYVEMLVDGEAEDAETREEFYHIIDSESDRLARMIDNILNISRIEAGVVKVQKQDMALAGIIKEVTDCLQPQAKEKEIDLVAEQSPMFYQVHADRDMLYQAVMNVVSNALKYTPAGGRVEVSSELKDGMAEVRVKDNGLGIPEEDLPHLFTKFYRVGANKKAAKGTGLGLALVKEIVETLHHGKVHVTSKVGQGTAFMLQLPVAD